MKNDKMEQKYILVGKPHVKEVILKNSAAQPGSCGGILNCTMAPPGRRKTESYCRTVVPKVWGAPLGEGGHKRSSRGAQEVRNYFIH
jgi:hypothetical protein